MAKKILNSELRELQKNALTMFSRDFWVLGLRAKCSQESFARSDFLQNSSGSIFLEATPDQGVWVGLDGWGPEQPPLPETSGKTSPSVWRGPLEVLAGARHVARGGLGLVTLGDGDAWRAGGGDGDAIAASRLVGVLAVAVLDCA